MAASQADPFRPILTALVAVMVGRIGPDKRWPISLCVAP
jgi:hypothetical protein